MFDAILENVASRFGIGPDKAKQLLGSLSSLIFSPEHGGPAGFVERLRSGGLGEAVQSWIGGGPNQPISPAQLESALGSGEVARIASQAGLDTTTTSSALSSMLPDVFNSLTGNGQLPTGIPAGLGGLLGGIGNTLGDFGRSGSAAAGAGTAAIGAGAAALGNTAGRAAGGVASTVSSGNAAISSGRSKWPLWILLLAVLALGWFFLRGCNRTASTDEAQPRPRLPAARPRRPPPTPRHHRQTR